MGCVKPLWLRDKKILAPCGQCQSCRAKRATSWSVRLAHELAYHDKSCFVTLTIDDEHMPLNGSLEKKRLQLFFKRLRKSIQPHKIKYYACGEYGERTYRAHYHAIIFGLGLKDKPLIESAWKEDGKTIGIVDIGLCEMRSIHYVAGYVRKKIQGMKDYEYKRLGFEPPFTLQSQGLGLRFAEDNSKQLTTNKTIRLNGLKTGLPRYYCDKLGILPKELRAEAIERSEKACAELLERHSDKIKASWFDAITDSRERLHYMKIELCLYRFERMTNESLTLLNKSREKKTVF